MLFEACGDGTGKIDAGWVMTVATKALEALSDEEKGTMMAGKSFGVSMISIERDRQLKKYDASHDDAHQDSALLKVAALLLGDEDLPITVETSILPQDSPWCDRLIESYPDDWIKRLSIAGALIAAEMDRRKRAMEKQLGIGE